MVTIALIRSASVGVRPVVGSGVTSPTLKIPNCIGVGSDTMHLDGRVIWLHEQLYHTGDDHPTRRTSHEDVRRRTPRWAVSSVRYSRRADRTAGCDVLDRGRPRGHDLGPDRDPDPCPDPGPRRDLDPD